MKYFKVAGIVWGFAYFVFGAWSSFMITSIDFWASVTLLFCIFLLPFPITIMGVWLPRVAGIALLGCILVNIAAIVYLVITDHVLSFSGISRYILFGAVWNLLHLVFGAGYIFLGQIQKNRYSGDEYI